MMKSVLPLLLLALSLPAFAADPAIDELEAQHMSGLMQFTMMQHVQKKRFSSEININTFSNFVHTLDPSRIFLLQKDVDAFHSLRMKMVSSFQNNNWSYVTNFYQGVFMPALRDSCAYAKDYLSSTNFVPDTSLKVPVEAKTIPWPNDDAARKEYLRGILNYQVAFLESMGEARSNAVKKVIKRRERILKYYEKQKAPAQFGFFLNAFCTALDPHSNYLPPEDLDDFNISMSLSLEGIGATLNQEDGYTIITELSPGSPAEKCGKLRPGDKIIAVAQDKDGEFLDVVDMELRDVVKKIRGKKGSTVRLMIMRKTKKGRRTFEVSLVRDKIKLEEQGPKMQIVEVSRTNGLQQVRQVRIAVLELSSFYLDTDSQTLLGNFTHSASQDVKKLLDSCSTQNVDGVILDFQLNGGGILTEAVNLAGLFLKRGNVVLADYSQGGQQQVLNDKDETTSYKGPLIITTSSMTASAAEIVTGALRAYDRCLVVGQSQTFGKGTIQQVIPLTGRLGALKVTKGLYYIADGKSPQFDGIKSDVVIPSNLDALQYGERFLPCALTTQRLTSRLSLDASTGKGVWLPVEKDDIARLQKSCAARLADCQEAQEIAKFVEKAEADRKAVYITIQELLEEKDKDARDEDEEDEFEEEEASSDEETPAETAEGEEGDEDADVEGDPDKALNSPENQLSGATVLNKAEREAVKMARKNRSITNNFLIQQTLEVFGDWLMPDTAQQESPASQAEAPATPLEAAEGRQN